MNVDPNVAVSGQGVVRRAGIACAFLLLATVAYAVVAFSQSAESSALVAGLCALTALGALLALAWSAWRLDFGAAVAWGYTALPLLGIELLLALPLVHPARLVATQCAIPYPDCGPVPASAWGPLALAVFSILATWAAIRRSKAAGALLERTRSLPQAPASESSST